MALLYPSYEVIDRQKVKHTPGEKKLLDFLVQNLDDSYELFYQPFLNGDQPDFVLMKENAGVVIIEVKDWNLDRYELNPKNDWILKKDKTPIQSPLWQVQRYKENLFTLHSDLLFEKRIRNKNALKVVNCLVYFHNAPETAVKEFLYSGEHQSASYKNFLNYLGLWGYDSLNQLALDKVIRKFRLHRTSKIFDKELYLSCKRFFNPPYHQLEEGIIIRYTKAQQELIRSEIRPYRKIKGAAGCGKTLVLAKRAVNAHKRTGGRVLILTYNLSLKNYIQDRISDVREGFYWDNFYIINYHQFFKTEANNHNLKIQGYDDWQDTQFFSSVRRELKKYDAILIDEIQDYHQSWLDIITENFMHENTEFVVFGDEKQNIYERELDSNNEIIVRKISGVWNKSMNKSHRFGNDIGKIALNFQQYFFHQKYAADDLSFLSQIDFEERIIAQYMINEASSVDCFSKIYEIIKENGIHSSDVAILGSSVSKLRDIDYLIRTQKREKTTITFEDREVYETIKNKRIEFLKRAGESENTIDLRAEKEIYTALEKIRRGRKNHFYMKTGTVKISTIHSFKGWEINTLFLIIDDEDSKTNAELIYTGLTRARKNLIILNGGNTMYQYFFESQMAG